MKIELDKVEPRPLTDGSYLDEFHCKDPDLEDFLKVDALKGQNLLLSNTTLLYFDNKLIGYYALSCDAIQLSTTEKWKLFGHRRKHYESYPAIKLARMAFVEDCRNQGCGTLVIEIIAGLVSRLSKMGVGCRFITVDAYPESVGFYEKKGFKRNLHKDLREKNHPSLRLDIFSKWG